MGKFIVFEGADGVGKSTQASLARLLLTTLGHVVLAVKEPGNPGVNFCRDIREMLFKKPYSDQLDAVEQGLLFFIDHYRNAKFVQYYLDKGEVVIADRWGVYSMPAYNAVTKELQLDAMNLHRQYETKLVQPDLVIHLDTDPETIMMRLHSRMGKDVSQEQKRALWGDKPEIEVHTELRQSYLNMSKRYQYAHELGHPLKWVTITQRPDQSPEDVFHKAVEPLLLDLMKSV